LRHEKSWTERLFGIWCQARACNRCREHGAHGATRARKDVDLPDYGEGSGVTSVSCLLFWETYMQASCQSDGIAQHADFKGFFKFVLRQGKQLPCEHPESRTPALRISSQSERR
jgi:hypothetical protein